MLMPGVIADQVVPFQRAMPPAGTPPALLKRPAATTSPLARVTSLSTCGGSGGIALLDKNMPEPIGNQALPFHRATQGEVPPNAPPATSSPVPLTARARTRTKPGIPDPNGDQDEPFHRATPLAAVPPIVVNWPPTTRSPFGSCASAKMLSFAVPSSDHAVPFQRATPSWPAPLPNLPLATMSPLASASSTAGESLRCTPSVVQPVAALQRLTLS